MGLDALHGLAYGILLVNNLLHQNTWENGAPGSETENMLLVLETSQKEA